MIATGARRPSFGVEAAQALALTALAHCVATVTGPCLRVFGALQPGWAGASYPTISETRLFWAASLILP